MLQGYLGWGVHSGAGPVLRGLHDGEALHPLMDPAVISDIGKGWN